MKSGDINKINDKEGEKMAKAGMRRPDPSQPHGTQSNKKQHFKKNLQEPVPEIQGRAKYGHEKANPTDKQV